MPRGVYERARPVADCPLSKRELQMVKLVGEGCTHKQIALKTGLAPSTVRTHLHNAYARLGVVGSAQVVIRCEHEGWITTPGGHLSRAGILQEIRTILLDCQRQLRQGTRHRVTSRQYAYLKAFDAFLREPGRDTDEAMVDALGAVLSDAQLIPAGDPRHAEAA